MARMRMEVKQCEKGHFYSGEYETCPFCFGNQNQEVEIPEWEPTMDANVVSTSKPSDISKGNTPPRFEIDDIEATTPVFIESYAISHDPVVGWLVCIKGPNRGKSYRLHSGSNFIGRGADMDVCIENDRQISNTNAASISYDDRTKIFFLERGDGRNNIFLNGSVLRRPEDVVRYDRIAIGASEFLFMPLCGERFDWKIEAEREKQDEKAMNRVSESLSEGYAETV